MTMHKYEGNPKNITDVEHLETNQVHKKVYETKTD